MMDDKIVKDLDDEEIRDREEKTGKVIKKRIEKTVEKTTETITEEKIGETPAMPPIDGGGGNGHHRSQRGAKQRLASSLARDIGRRKSPIFPE